MQMNVRHFTNLKIHIKYCFCFLVFAVTTFSYAQKLVSGKVVDYKGTNLPGASVYLNNTTIGTITKEDGTFNLTIYEGNYELIISFIGYKTRKENLNIVHYSEPLKFVLVPETNILDEVVLKPTKYDDEWRRNLKTFKNTFLGRTKLAASCEILNPKVLHFETNQEKGTLNATSREPLKIVNKGLGYLKEYDLIDYTINNQKLTYIGYSRYSILPGGKSKQRRWKKNRLKAYLGSRMHFVRSLRNKKLRAEGFDVDQLRRTSNTERPDDHSIKRAHEVVKTSRGVNFYKKIIEPKTALDSAILIIRKARMPKFKEIIYKKNLNYKDLVSENGSILYLDFDDFLSITYLKEKEELNYLNFLPHRRSVQNQRSIVTLSTDKAILDPTGAILDPLDYYSEGYWAYEQYADMLPLDYQPNK